MQRAAERGTPPESQRCQEVLERIMLCHPFRGGEGEREREEERERVVQWCIGCRDPGSQSPTF